MAWRLMPAPGASGIGAAAMLVRRNSTMLADHNGSASQDPQLEEKHWLPTLFAIQQRQPVEIGSLPACMLACQLQ